MHLEHIYPLGWFCVIIISIIFVILGSESFFINYLALLHVK